MSEAEDDRKRVEEERAKRLKGFVGHNGWRYFAFAMLLGGLGGFTFNLLRMPLAWMMGAAVVCTVAAMSGLPVGVHNRVRQVMMVILGVLLGSGFSPQMLDHVPKWFVTMAIMVLMSVASAGSVWWLLRRRGGYDGRTAYFAAMPGGLNEMVMLGSVYGANERTIALMHAVRILTVVTVIPFFYRLMYGTVSSVFQASAAPSHSLRDVAILIGCGAVGALIATRIKMPAGMMFGPMLASGVVHLMGWTASKPPGELVAFAQVIIGSAIGCRFVGAVFRDVARDMVYGFFSAILLIVIAVFFAQLGHFVSGLPTDDIALSYAPGGFAEMSLVGLALHADIAMVATHHLFRIFAIVFIGSWVYRRFVEPKLRERPPPTP